MTDEREFSGWLDGLFPAGEEGGENCAFTRVVAVMPPEAFAGPMGKSLTAHLSQCESCRQVRSATESSFPEADDADPVPAMPGELAELMKQARRRRAEQSADVIAFKPRELGDSETTELHSLPLAASRGRATEDDEQTDETVEDESKDSDEEPESEE